MKTQLKDLPTNENGDIIDTARVEIGVLGPRWLKPCAARFRFYMGHSPDDHLTAWMFRWLSSIVGGWAPPAWFLRLIVQVKK